MHLTKALCISVCTYRFNISSLCPDICNNNRTIIYHLIFHVHFCVAGYCHASHCLLLCGYYHTSEFSPGHL